jgi:glycosidase
VRRKSGVVRNSRVFELDGAVEVGRGAVYTGHRAYPVDGKGCLEVTVREGDWEITSLYRLTPKSDTLERDLRVTYHGLRENLLHDVRLPLPFLRLGEESDVFLEAPAYPVEPHFCLADLADGVWPGLGARPQETAERVQLDADAPGSVPGVVGLHSPNAGVGLMLWPHSTSEFSILEAEKRGGGLGFIQWLFLADRFQPGAAIEAERQYVRIFHGGWETALRERQAWYAGVGLAAPGDRPPWCEGTSIYEVHVGRAPFLDGVAYEPYPKIADLTRDLDRIAGLGFEVVQVMPHWPFCGYTVHDYHQVDQQYGDEGELREMIAAAHRLGLKVILDVVLHGCVDREIVRWDMAQLDPRYHFIFGEWLRLAQEFSPYRENHPQWFMQDENGETARIYTWAFDLADPSFQEFFIGVLRFYLEEFQVDGFRFDAPSWNCMPNWKPGLPRRASASYYAAYHLLKRARQEIRPNYPQALFYTEPEGPLFRSVMDLTYNYTEEWISGSLMAVRSSRGYAGSRTYTGGGLAGREIAEWLRDRSLALPSDAETVHHLDSHDTFWWGEKAQFRREAFGEAAARALFAFFALQGGGIMVYTGAERGSQGFYRRLLRLRQADPVLRRGECDFLAVRCDQAQVLPLLRVHENRHAIPLINLGEAPVRGLLSIPYRRLGLAAGQACAVEDILNGERIAPVKSDRLSASDLEGLTVDLEGFGVRVLRIESLFS